MVSTFQINQVAMLQPLKSRYEMRVFSTEDGILKAQHAQPEYYMSFSISINTSLAWACFITFVIPSLKT